MSLIPKLSVRSSVQDVKPHADVVVDLSSSIMFRPWERATGALIKAEIARGLATRLEAVRPCLAKHGTEIIV
jgi:hypothetical protein